MRITSFKPDVKQFTTLSVQVRTKELLKVVAASREQSMASFVAYLVEDYLDKSN